jgi:phosphatidylinositol glycan class B
VRSFFSADEYWQSLEVAHRVAFGCGRRSAACCCVALTLGALATAHRYGYLTWEWFGALRGWAHPLLFAALYRALGAAGADTPAALALAPRLAQAALSAGGDVATYVLARRLFGPRAGAASLGCQLASWCAFYAGARTFSSSAEAPLSAAALAGL